MSPLRSALIGSTGFVGSNLMAQERFDEKFHRSDIDVIRGRDYGLIVCAGAPGGKWIANRESEADGRTLRSLMAALDNVHAEEFVLVSTIDVYAHPTSVTEGSEVVASGPYGSHRFELEDFVSRRFPNHRIIRLPGLFGPGLRKNVIFDLLNGNQVGQVDPSAVLQWYDVGLLWRDIGILRQSDVRLLNLATEPVENRVISTRFFPDVAVGTPSRAAPKYDVRTLHSRLFGKSGAYCYTQDETLACLGSFVAAVREGSVLCGFPYRT